MRDTQRGRVPVGRLNSPKKRKPDSLQDVDKVGTPVHAHPELEGKLAKLTLPQSEQGRGDGVRRAGLLPVWKVAGGVHSPSHSHQLSKYTPHSGH